MPRLFPAFAFAALLAVAASPPEKAFLVKVSESGGLCPDGACANALTFQRDGSYIWTGVAGKLRRKGKLDAKKVKALVAALEAADFPKMKSKGFRGQCPTNYDGTERMYVFRTKAGLETLASCTYELDKGLPLFKLVDETVSEIYKLGPERTP